MLYQLSYFRGCRDYSRGKWGGLALRLLHHPYAPLVYNPPKEPIAMSVRHRVRG